MALYTILESHGSRMMVEHGGVYFVTTGAFGGHVANAEAALRAGVRIIQYRNNDGEMRQMIDDLRQIGELCKNKEICKDGTAILIVNNRVDLALAAIELGIDIDGVHIGQSDMPIKIAKSLLPEKMIVGVSVSTVGQAVEARRDGADYLGVTIKESRTKPEAVGLGWDAFGQICTSVGIPVYAIGGMDKEQVGKVKQKIRWRREGGVAVISAIAAAPDKVRAGSELVDAWRGA